MTYLVIEINGSGQKIVGDANTLSEAQSLKQVMEYTNDIHTNYCEYKIVKKENQNE